MRRTIRNKGEPAPTSLQLVRRDVGNSVSKFVARHETAAAAGTPSIFVLGVVRTDVGKAKFLFGDFISESIIESEFPTNRDSLSLAREVRILRGEILQGIVFAPSAFAELGHGYCVALRWVERYQLRERCGADLNCNMCLGRYYVPSIQELHNQDFFVRHGIVSDARLLEYHDGTHGADQLLLHQGSLLLNLSKCVLGGLGSFSVGAVNSSSIERIGDQKTKADKFCNNLGNVPFVAPFFAGYAIAGVGWWNLHFRNGIAVWVCCIIVGIALALWGGWNWLIVGHSKTVPQVSNRTVTGLVASDAPWANILCPSNDEHIAIFRAVCFPKIIVVSDKYGKLSPCAGQLDALNLLRSEFVCKKGGASVVTRYFGKNRFQVSKGFPGFPVRKLFRIFPFSNNSPKREVANVFGGDGSNVGNTRIHANFPFIVKKIQSWFTWKSRYIWTKRSNNYPWLISELHRSIRGIGGTSGSNSGFFRGNRSLLHLFQLTEVDQGDDGVRYNASDPDSYKPPLSGFNVIFKFLYGLVIFALAVAIGFLSDSILMRRDWARWPLRNRLSLGIGWWCIGGWPTFSDFFVHHFQQRVPHPCVFCKGWPRCRRRYLIC
jgi:hypothetical protein